MTRVRVEVELEVRPADTMALLMSGGDVTEGRYAGTTFGCTTDQSGLWVRVKDEGVRGPLVILNPQAWLASALDAAARVGYTPTKPTPACPVCGRWNDPTGGPEAHSGGCPNAGKVYPGADR